MRAIHIKQNNIVKKIKNYNPPFVIAEVGVNHNGDLETAKRLIDVSKKSGADAVKFQTFSAEGLVLKDAKKAKYQIKNTKDNENQYEMLKKLEISHNELKELQQYSNKIGLFFSTTPYSIEDINQIKDLDLPFLKAASIHCGEPYFLEALSKLDKPIFLSTGLSNMDTVIKASKILKKRLKNKFIILQCTSNYPSSLEESNINVIDSYREEGFNVGFSDHTPNNLSSILALSKGASVFEKHITLNKKSSGPDHYASLNPEEFSRYVQDLRNAYTALGSRTKMLTLSERTNFSQMKRSMYINKDLYKGHILSIKDIVFMRPYSKSSKISDIDLFLNKEISKDVKKYTLLNKKLI